jgi:hypothetical protein
MALYDHENNRRTLLIKIYMSLEHNLPVHTHIILPFFFFFG